MVTVLQGFPNDSAIGTALCCTNIMIMLNALLQANKSKNVIPFSDYCFLFSYFMQYYFKNFMTV